MLNVHMYIALSYVHLMLRTYVSLALLASQPLLHAIFSVLLVAAL